MQKRTLLKLTLLMLISVFVRIDAKASYLQFPGQTEMFNIAFTSKMVEILPKMKIDRNIAIKDTPYIFTLLENAQIFSIKAKRTNFVFDLENTHQMNNGQYLLLAEVAANENGTEKILIFYVFDIQESPSISYVRHMYTARLTSAMFPPTILSPILPVINGFPGVGFKTSNIEPAENSDDPQPIVRQDSSDDVSSDSAPPARIVILPDPSSDSAEQTESRDITQPVIPTVKRDAENKDKPKKVAKPKDIKTETAKKGADKKPKPAAKSKPAAVAKGKSNPAKVAVPKGTKTDTGKKGADKKPKPAAKSKPVDKIKPAKGNGKEKKQA